MHTWKVPYGQRVEVNDPVKLPDSETLAKTRAGISKRLRKETDPDRKYRLQVMRAEIDYLIDNL